MNSLSNYFFLFQFLNRYCNRPPNWDSSRLESTLAEELQLLGDKHTGELIYVDSLVMQTLWEWKYNNSRVIMTPWWPIHVQYTKSHFEVSQNFKPFATVLEGTIIQNRIVVNFAMSSFSSLNNVHKLSISDKLFGGVFAEE